MTDNRKDKKYKDSKIYNQQVTQYTTIIKKVKTKVNRLHDAIRQLNGKSESKWSKSFPLSFKQKNPWYILASDGINSNKAGPTFQLDTGDHFTLTRVGKSVWQNIVISEEGTDFDSYITNQYSKTTTVKVIKHSKS